MTASPRVVPHPLCRNCTPAEEQQVSGRSLCFDRPVDGKPVRRTSAVRSRAGCTGSTSTGCGGSNALQARQSARCQPGAHSCRWSNTRGAGARATSRRSRVRCASAQVAPPLRREPGSLAPGQSTVAGRSHSIFRGRGCRSAPMPVGGPRVDLVTVEPNVRLSRIAEAPLRVLSAFAARPVRQ